MGIKPSYDVLDEVDNYRYANKEWAEIDKRRASLGVTRRSLCSRAGVSVYSYRELLYGRYKYSENCTIEKVTAALDECETEFRTTGKREVENIPWTKKFAKIESRRVALGVTQKWLCQKLGISPQTYRDFGKGLSTRSNTVDTDKIEEFLTMLEEGIHYDGMGENKKIDIDGMKKKREYLKKRKELEAMSYDEYVKCLMREIDHSGMVKESFRCPGKLETDSQCLLREKCRLCPYLDY